MTISTVNVETEDNLRNRQQIPTRCGSVRVRSTPVLLTLLVIAKMTTLQTT